MPRHPPDTLSSLTTFIDHRRVPHLHLMQTSGPAGRAVTVEMLAHPAIANGPDSPKRCSTITPRQKDQNGEGSQLTQLQLGVGAESFEPQSFTCQRACSDSTRSHRLRRLVAVRRTRKGESSYDGWPVRVRPMFTRGQLFRLSVESSPVRRQ